MITSALLECGKHAITIGCLQSRPNKDGLPGATVLATEINPLMLDGHVTIGLETHGCLRIWDGCKNKLAANIQCSYAEGRKHVGTPVNVW